MDLSNISSKGEGVSDLRGELFAMHVIGEALAKLEQDESSRVLSWALAKFGSDKNVKSLRASNINNQWVGTPEVLQVNSSSSGIEDYETVAELFGAANPKTQQEKLLVVSSYKQVTEKLSQFDSTSINKELQNLGHKVNEISKVFNKLIDKKPQLVVQLRKSGKSKQSRKVYKVTAAGITYVRAMLEKNSSEKLC